MTEWKLKRTRDLKLQAVAYLGGKCVKCGYNKCVNALEFHHLRNKIHEPTVLIQNSTRLDQIKSELDKCEILCANCHREKTFDVV